MENFPEFDKNSLIINWYLQYFVVPWYCRHPALHCFRNFTGIPDIFSSIKKLQNTEIQNFADLYRNVWKTDIKNISIHTALWKLRELKTYLVHSSQNERWNIYVTFGGVLSTTCSTFTIGAWWMSTFAGVSQN